jgi:lysophospholipase L1-like esterase
LQAELEKRWQKRVEVLNAGVTGYSSLQGLRRLRVDVLPYRPGLVVVYCGWNDHWLWSKMTDAELLAESTRPRQSWLAFAADLQASRTVQAVFFVEELVRSARTPPVRHQKCFRVPIDAYQRNLVAMIASIRDAGAVPLVVTAPTDMTPATAPEHVGGMLEGLDMTGYRSPYDLHEAYVRATRQAASAAGAPLADAYRAFGGKHGLIRRDHIHLTAAGIDAMAILLADAINEHVPARRYRQSDPIHEHVGMNVSHR